MHSVNEQEIQRNPSVVNGTAIDAISSNVDDKTMHETYLWPFANAVRAGTASIMCSYNRINGSYGEFAIHPTKYQPITRHTNIQCRLSEQQDSQRTT